MHANLIVLGLAAIFSTVSSSTKLDALRRGSAKFSLDLFSVLRESRENENLVVSPIGLEIVLAMLYPGTSGSTKESMAKVLHVENSDVQEYVNSYKDLLETIKDPALSLASTVFVDKHFKLLDSYITAISNGFGTSVETVNFQDSVTAVKSINDWCDKHTDGMIKDFYGPGDLLGVEAVLVSAVYFKASWNIQFDVNHTREVDFSSPTGIIKVQMMFVKANFLYKFCKKLNAQILELPYANKKFRMIVILPSKGTPLKDVELNLKTLGLETVLQDMFTEDVKVFLPRFTIAESLDLTYALDKLGAGDLFSSPDLRGISELPLHIRRLKQKVIFEVTEEGTKAVAVTGTQIRSLIQPIIFNADRPFLFHLTDEKYTALFSGAVLKA